MILLLHNRYRTLGGEERVVDDLLRIIPAQLGEPAELLERRSEDLSRRAGAVGVLRGGLDPADVVRVQPAAQQTERRCPG